MTKFADIMYKMFPLYQPPVDAENLTEIPMPVKTLHQRFLTISESEPFGPIDAAKVFGIEPAGITLKKLTQVDDTKEEIDQSHTQEVIVGIQKQGDRGLFKFVNAQAGEVGYRYGTSLRDTKRDRAIGYDRAGKAVNLV